MTTHRGHWSNSNTNRDNQMISPVRQQTPGNRNNHHHLNHNPMMTRHHSGRNLPRNTHENSYKGATMRHNPIHRLRSPILCIILLSILPQKIITNNRNRINMTTYRNSTLQPITSTTTKYSYSTRIRSDSYMSTSQPTRK